MLSPAIQSWQDALRAQEDATGERREAFARFLALGLPTQKMDEWKHTDLRRLALKPFRPASAVGAAADVESLLLKFDAYRFVLIDGVASTSQPGGSEAKGFTVEAQRSSIPATAATRITQDGERAHTDAFDLLNRALGTSHIAIDIAEERSLDRPIYLAHAWSAQANGVMTHPRLRIRVGRYGKAVLIQHHVGANSASNLTNAAVDIELGEHASLDHISIQDDAAANFRIASARVDVGAGATYRHFNYALGASLARSNIAVQLSGRDAAAELNGLVLAQHTQHLDVHTCIEHRVPHTRSHEDYRGIADHRGRVVFTGKVVVAKDAQKTDAAQSSRNLLLSPHAEIDTRPVLEIYANDVKCAHGATVGQLDATALFYLRSRGLSSDEARALLTHAFAAELIERAPVQAVREHVLSRLMERLRTQGSSL